MATQMAEAMAKAERSTTKKSTKGMKYNIKTKAERKAHNQSLKVPCPHCPAKIGEHCVSNTKKGGTTAIHKKRHQFYRMKQADKVRKAQEAKKAAAAATPGMQLDKPTAFVNEDGSLKLKGKSTAQRSSQWHATRSFNKSVEHAMETNSKKELAKLLVLIELRGKASQEELIASELRHDKLLQDMVDNRNRVGRMQETIYTLRSKVEAAERLLGRQAIRKELSDDYEDDESRAT